MNDVSRGGAARSPASGDADLAALDQLAGRRLRIGIMLTVGQLIVYFGFILLVALNKQGLGTILTEGLSLGILLGVLVILATWGLTWTYVGWANRVYEPEIQRLRR